MVLNRAKIIRSTDKNIVRTTISTAHSLTTKESLLCQQKSMIPTLKSISQPSNTYKSNSMQRIRDNGKTKSVTNKGFEKELDIKSDSSKQRVKVITNPIKNHLESIPTTVSIVSDDFKDALDGNSYSGTFNEEKHKSENPRNMKNSKSLTNKKYESLSRKNSLSAISVSQKLSKTMNKTPILKKPLNSSSLTSSIPTSKRALEMQFVTKKKRYDLLKKEISDKQKPVLELYQALNDIKKKLEENGKYLTLDVPRVINFDEKSARTAGGEQVSPNGIIESDMLIALKTIFNQYNQLDATVDEECKKMVMKYEEIIKSFDQTHKDDSNLMNIKKRLGQFKQSDSKFLCNLKTNIAGKNKILTDIYEKLNNLASNTDQTEGIKLMESKLQHQEIHIKELNLELQRTKNQLKGKEISVTEEEIFNLKEKNAALENALEAERRRRVAELEKYKHSENKEKALRSAVKVTENVKNQAEERYRDLYKDYRTVQSKLLNHESKHSREIVEINKARDLDKALIEKLNKDKATFESRIKLAMDTIDQLKTEKDEIECSLLKQLSESKDEADIAHNCITQLKKELERAQKQLNDLELQNQQAADLLISTQKTKGGTLETCNERESELQLELATQRSTIKALQEKIESNAEEKLRFIETIDKLNGNSEEQRESLGKNLMKKQEQLNFLETTLKRRDEEISNLKIDVEKLKTDKQTLIAKVQGIDCDDGSDEMKHMLKDGKLQLENALLKSLENEHKLIKYEHELAQKCQVILNLENLMKVRDGLLGMMKAKKDELSMENLSLTKYSEEVRNCVLESKQELKINAEQITDLRSSLDEKCKDLFKSEQRIKELEERLSITNEKRYKLQDTVTNMEKELQTLKAKINSESDHAKTDIGTAGQIGHMGLKPWNNTGTKLFNHYKTAYQREQLLKTFGLPTETRTDLNNMCDVRQEAVRDDDGKAPADERVKFIENVNRLAKYNNDMTKTSRKSPKDVPSTAQSLISDLNENIDYTLKLINNSNVWTRCTD